MNNSTEDLPVIPSEWTWVCLQDICSLATGKTPSTREELYWNGNIPFVTPSQIHPRGYMLPPKRWLTSIGAEKVKIIPDGSILIVCIGSVGKVGYLNRDAVINQQLNALLPSIAIVPRFLFYWSKHYLQEWVVRNAVATVNAAILNKTRLSGAPAPLVPLNEQHRIVTKIETLTARSRKAREALDAIPALLDQFRQSVLAAAFRGDLTADWREQNPDVEPAEKLLERIQEERRSRWEAAEIERMKAKGKVPRKKWKEKYKEPDIEEFELSCEASENWAATSIGRVSECLDRLRVPINRSERAKRKGDIPYYGANGLVGWIDEYLFDDDLVIVVEDETFVGRTKPFSYKITGKSWVNNHAHVLKPLGQISTDFFNYSLMFYPFIPLTSGTTGRRKLTQKALFSAPYLLPPLEEQKEIVSMLSRYLQLADSIQVEVESRISSFERLDQSILAKAFRGELVPQDPTDEPATLLLQRIQAERENQKAKGKRKTKKKK